jgi:hypothetical protein
MALSHQRREQFGLQQVHLAKVGLRRVARHARTVLHGFTTVRIAFHAQAGEQRDALEALLGEFVDRAEVHGEDMRAHVRRF